jgi:type IV pilus assembly protein PilB
VAKVNLDKLLRDLEAGPPTTGADETGPDAAGAETPDRPGGDAKPAVAPKAETLRSIYRAEGSSDEASHGAQDLGEMLERAGAVTAEQLSSARTVLKQTPGASLPDLLMEMEADQEKIQRVVADHYRLGFTRLDLENIDDAVDGGLVQRLTPAFCKKHGLIPIRKDGGRLVLGVVSPDDVFLLDDVRRRLSATSSKLAIITPDDLSAVLEHFGEAESEDLELEDILGDIEEDDVQVSESSIDSVDLEKEAGESPVIRYVNYILQTAVKEGASDIHIEPGEDKLKVRFRIDGVLFEMMNPPRTMAAAITSRLKIMGNLDISERRLPQDGRIRCTVQGRKLDLRVSTLPCAAGEKTVMRILDTRSINVTLDQLGFDENTLEIWKNQIGEPNGIVLVTGPTGSGKTTTLYSSLRSLDKQKLNISTVEDPIEYHLDGITQTQTHDKIGMSFGSALRALLRQDPDVILVGEIRDHETAHIAVQASLTGHLVLSTLHTNDAPGSVTRLINIGLEPFLVGAAVNGVLAQRLVRRVCQNCRQETEASEEMAEFLELNGMPGATLWAGQGCDKCRNTGYAGRVGIYELLVVDDSIRDVIARNPNVSEFRRLCIERGMTPLRQDGLMKAAQGLTTVQEVLRVTESH